MDHYELPGRPRVGDRVKFIEYDLSLCATVRYGEVKQSTGEVSRVQTENDGVFAVPHAMATRIMGNNDVLNHLLDKLKLIAAQGEGRGGNATPEQCWDGAKQIARTTLAEFGVQR